MRIVVDAMGSDAAPDPEVRGAVEASLAGDVSVTLVGNREAIEKYLKSHPKHGQIAVVHAADTISMDESPLVAVRKKKNASILVGLRLVKEGKADAFVSAGSTGAVMLASRVVLGPLKGVARSAICQVLPTKRNPVVVLDLGANVDCTARQLCDFAEMGLIFSESTLDVKNPRVGLINIGKEQTKGNEVAREVHQSLSRAKHINFIGNIEPRAMFEGNADVVVCDGFVGNIILKTGEAVAGLVKTLVQRELKAGPVSMLGGLLSLGAFRRLRKQVDPNLQPGAPLLGVNGTVIIVHGSGDHKAIRHAILGARDVVQLNLNERIRHGIERLRAETGGEAALEPAK